MSGRRSHPRFDVTLASAGTLRVSKDVIVEQVERDEVVVMCREPGVPDARLSVHLADAETAAGVAVTVAESRPVIQQGAVRYRLHLRVNREGAGGDGRLLLQTAPSADAGGVNG